jgi:hypothetical protein
MSLISLLIVLLIFCVVVWAARALMAAFGIGDPIATVVYVFLVLIALLFLLQALGGVNLGGHGLRIN